MIFREPEALFKLGTVELPALPSKNIRECHVGPYVHRYSLYGQKGNFEEEQPACNGRVVHVYEVGLESTMDLVFCAVLGLKPRMRNFYERTLIEKAHLLLLHQVDVLIDRQERHLLRLQGGEDVGLTFGYENFFPLQVKGGMVQILGLNRMGSRWVGNWYFFPKTTMRPGDRIFLGDPASLD
jgi:hypothetical protein